MSTAQLELLTSDELDALKTCERVIEEGRKVFLEVGEALLTIRDRRLYKENHPTFEAYCKQRWDFSRSKAYQMIEAVMVTVNLLEGGVAPDQLPANEAQTRPLAALPPGEQAEAWQEAKATAPGGQVTATHVSVTVSKRLPEEPAKPPKQPSGQNDMLADFFKEPDAAPETGETPPQEPEAIAAPETPQEPEEPEEAPEAVVAAPDAETKPAGEVASSSPLVQHGISRELDDALWEADMLPLEKAGREALRLRAILTPEAERLLQEIVYASTYDTTPGMMLETVLSIYLKTRGLTVSE